MLLKKLNLATKSDTIALKTEFDKLDINKLANVPSCLNSLDEIGWLRCS